MSLLYVIKQRKSCMHFPEYLVYEFGKALTSYEIVYQITIRLLSANLDVS